MKKLSVVLVGILSPLYYYLVLNLMMYIGYSEKYAFVQNLMLFLLPTLPGVVLAFTIIRNSLKDFFISLGSCFLLSIIVFAIYELFDIDLIIFKTITGYDEFSLGEGLLFFITSMSYIISCFIGVFVSGIISLRKQKNCGIKKNDMECEK